MTTKTFRSWVGVLTATAIISGCASQVTLPVARDAQLNGMPDVLKAYRQTCLANADNPDASLSSYQRRTGGQVVELGSLKLVTDPRTDLGFQYDTRKKGCVFTTSDLGNEDQLAAQFQAVVGRFAQEKGGQINNTMGESYTVTTASSEYFLWYAHKGGEQFGIETR